MQDIATLLQNLITQKAAIKSAVEYLNDDTVTDTFETYAPMIQKRIVSVDDSVFEQYYTDIEDYEELDHGNTYNVYTQKQCVFDTNGEHILRIFREQVEKMIAGIFTIETTSTELQYRNIKTFCVINDSLWTDASYSSVVDDTIPPNLTEDDISGLTVTRDFWGIVDDNATGVLKYDFDKICELKKPHTFYYMPNLTHIDSVSYGSSLKCMFTYLKKSIDLSNLTIDVTDVTDISYMFAGSKGLTNIPVFVGNGSHITSLSSTFAYCDKLTSIDLTPFTGCPITDLSYTFAYCDNLTSIDLTPFTGCPITSLSNTFRYCKKLTSIDLTPFTGCPIKNLSYTFAECSKLTSIDLTPFTGCPITSLSSTFAYCYKLTSIDLTPFTGCPITSLSSTFAYCYKLTSIDLTPFTGCPITSLSSTFRYCDNLTSIDLTPFTGCPITSLSYTFAYCNNLTSIDFGTLIININSSGTLYWGYTFDICTSLTTVTGTLSGIKFNLDLHWSPLTRDSALIFINGLSEITTTQTLKLKSTTFDSLTEEDIAIATAKGWSVVSA